uniref:Alpha-mannosidase n=1 Tax=Arundo donax TaxID=35708 RepID=A0A0A9CRF8_ARUDO
MVSPSNDTIEVGPGPLKMSFSATSGQLKRIFNSVSGVDLPIQQSFLWYRSSTGDGMDSQASGAYIFRPDGNTPTIISTSVPLKVIHGPLVDEVHQQFSAWVYQVTRLYKNKDHAEVEYTIGPIPVEDDVGKEVITRLTANMVTNSTFYTDSNGRDFLKRVRNYREDWNLQVTQPVAGNYYPVNLGVYLADGKYELSVLVDRAVGASSIQDGQLEIMLHRRIIQDDGRGVAESLNEVVCVDQDCEGLTARGTYYINVGNLGHGAHWRRTYGQQVYSPFLLAFTHEDETSWKSYNAAKASMMDKNYTLPENVAIVTLQNLDDGTTLLRLAHLYQVAEDPQYSVMAKVELRKVFGKRTIKELTETNLSANQKISEVKKLNWKVDGDTESGPAPLKGGPVDSQALVVELGPMEIRTFLLKF